VIRKLIAGSALVIAATGAMSASGLHATGPAQATSICVSGSTTGVVNVNPIGACFPYAGSVNCQTVSAGLTPTLDATVTECSPH
jgi:hypothetical protein